MKHRERTLKSTDREIKFTVQVCTPVEAIRHSDGVLTLRQDGGNAIFLSPTQVRKLMELVSTD